MDFDQAIADLAEELMEASQIIINDGERVLDATDTMPWRTRLERMRGLASNMAISVDNFMHAHARDDDAND